MPQDNEMYDVVVIGGGPAGLFTAFYAGMRGLSVKIVESLPHLGGQLTALYPEKFIYDVAGFPKVRAQELVDNLTEQMEEFEPTVCLDQSLEKVEKQQNGTFILASATGDVHYSRTIIITAGNGAFQPKKLKLEEAEDYEDGNLHYFINDLSRFEGKRVVVFGGGDSAVDWALMLEPIAKEVTIVHRRDAFRAHEHSVENLMTSTVNIQTPYEPVKLVGEDKIEQVILKKTKSVEEKTIEVDEVIVNYGFVSKLGPITDWGLNIDKNSIAVNSRMETNIEGIYAAGDVTTFDGKVKLIATGFGEAPVAVSSAKVYIEPDAKLQPAHSTSIMDQTETKQKADVK
ncbi:NAD(P)/FAD-dependent oxidoreductase [Salibacterium salarium]|uniref:Ferredoxin--NADP reductase n=1 Tax=Salibacterium salarium TaxID=284579 RepID=A0A428N3T2_9BACI|nr:NAD(P)/FAD-dependent oxidoreductase [Salibacterium salarium]RSL33114.1 NAD(P)/FAD-dependent oxidoreductase [Salibacterium salarium]